MKRLIINADDFGYSLQRNRGIVECFKNKSITSTSLLVNSVAMDDAVHHIRHLGIPAGVHLNLTEGLPVGRHFESLVDENGFFLGKLGFRDAIQQGSIQYQDLRTEITAQLNAYYEAVGRKPTHVDGHQHVHVLPVVRDVFAKVLEQQGIRWTRLPAELDLDSCTWSSQGMRAFFNSVVENAASSQEVFTKHSIRFPDGFVGLSTMGKEMTSDRVVQALTNIMNHNPATSTIEWMVHPGYPTEIEGGCGSGADDFSRSPDRFHEVEVLNNTHLKQHFKENRFKLVAFSNLNQK
ncbi:carbohydrate deacetylase-like isoform X2 [Anneissia japonica]|uniref:carbohydrate deacetylase-like isoform X2 n=1 Tax=Anneissia japonica TaxID=1529436 RepID=UPI001425B1C1|nr:carbohydrate deacetylase-like isoform X2 [Anneissia japonica]